MEASTQGRTVLFDTSHPDGITAPDGSPHPLVEAALKMHDAGFDVARIVHSHGGKVMVEHPVGHGKKSLWPIRGREDHSTLFDTTIFRNCIKESLAIACTLTNACWAQARARLLSGFATMLS